MLRLDRSLSKIAYYILLIDKYYVFIYYVFIDIAIYLFMSRCTYLLIYRIRRNILMSIYSHLDILYV